MTNLTELWKKGELTGEYWCEITESPYPERVYLPTCDSDIIVKVLAEVPSYELWKAVHEQRNVLFVENTKLKAVLKRCREFVDDFSTDNDESWAYKNAVLNGIDELLGEE